MVSGAVAFNAANAVASTACDAFASFSTAASTETAVRVSANVLGEAETIDRMCAVPLATVSASTSSGTWTTAPTTWARSLAASSDSG